MCVVGVCRDISWPLVPLFPVRVAYPYGVNGRIVPAAVTTAAPSRSANANAADPAGPRARPPRAAAPRASKMFRRAADPGAYRYDHAHARRTARRERGRAIGRAAAAVRPGVAGEQFVTTRPRRKVVTSILCLKFKIEPTNSQN